MKRAFLVCFLVLSAAAMSFGQTTFYYPHVVNGLLGGVVWKTTILLTNPGSVGSGAVSGSVTFNQDTAVTASAGSAFLGISFTDETGASIGSGGVVPFQIAGGQSKKIVSTGAGNYTGGFATVKATGTITGTAIFSEFLPSGQLIGEAGVPAGVAVTRQIVFTDTTGGYHLGAAFANPGASTANVTLNLLNASAVTVDSTTFVLGTLNHTAGFVDQNYFPADPQLAGTLQIISSAPLTVIALRFDPTFSVFTTLPPVTIASMFEPAVKWFEQRPWAHSIETVARLMASLNLRLG